MSRWWAKKKNVWPGDDSDISVRVCDNETAMRL